MSTLPSLNALVSTFALSGVGLALPCRYRTLDKIHRSEKASDYADLASPGAPVTSADDLDVGIIQRSA
jgi:hypothetical protein